MAQGTGHVQRTTVHAAGGRLVRPARLMRGGWEADAARSAMLRGGRVQPTQGRVGGAEWQGPSGRGRELSRRRIRAAHKKGAVPGRLTGRSWPADIHSARVIRRAENRNIVRPCQSVGPSNKILLRNSMIARQSLPNLSCCVLTKRDTVRVLSFSLLHNVGHLTTLVSGDQCHGFRAPLLPCNAFPPLHTFPPRLAVGDTRAAVCVLQRLHQSHVYALAQLLDLPSNVRSPRL